MAVPGSYYGMSNLTINLQDVNCIGNEYSIAECSKTITSLNQGKVLIQQVDVAGVDCMHDEPTSTPPVPVCITHNESVNTDYTCSTDGSIRLMYNDVESTSEGRVEYCTGLYWMPLCTLDNKAAAVICKQMGHTQYQCKSQYT